ncbi:RNA-directed DNA polymerase, eukaryota, reverse transcriptase zinc-binding domain protein [Tanacetum coccineum]
MIDYFKTRWEEDRQKESEDTTAETDIEDVLEVNTGTVKVMGDNEISGMNTSEKHNEVMNLIRSESIKVCVVLETRLKIKKLQNSCDRVFQGWDWISNMHECSKGCRIVVGWDNDDTSVQVLHKTNQSIFCVVSADKYKFKIFFTFVYVANEGLERRRLWEELIKENSYVSGRP